MNERCAICSAQLLVTRFRLNSHGGQSAGRPLADEIGLKDNSPVRLSLRDRQLVIVPVVQPALSLEALLVQVTDSNRHAEVLTDPAVGDEAWQRSAY